MSTEFHHRFDMNSNDVVLFFNDMYFWLLNFCFIGATNYSVEVLCLITVVKIKVIIITIIIIIIIIIIICICICICIGNNMICSDIWHKYHA